MRVHKALQILFVSDADAGDLGSAAFFVSRALVPSAQAAPGLNLVRRHGQDTDRGILETADMFILVAPATLTGEAVEIMTRRVQEGARFLAVLDGPTAPGLAPAGLSPPFRLLRTVVSEAGDALVPGPRKLFADADAGDWSAARFRRHYQNQVLPGQERGRRAVLCRRFGCSDYFQRRQRRRGLRQPGVNAGRGRFYRQPDVPRDAA